MFTLLVLAGLAYWYFNSRVTQTAHEAVPHVVAPRHNVGEVLGRTVLELIAKSRRPHGT